MNEFIEGFGKDNFIIISVVVGIILFSLLVIIIIEKIQENKRSNNMNKINKEVPSYNENIIIEEEPRKEIIKPEPIQIKEEEELLDDEVFYKENEITQEEAKEKLEEVTRKLVEEQEPIEHTEFETEQEEKSIISYDELLNASKNIDYENDKVLNDEAEVAITIDELYNKYNEPKQEEKQFRNSDVISPVFGVYSGEVKQDANVITEEDKPNDLEQEIARSGDYIEELNRLKNKLD